MKTKDKIITPGDRNDDSRKCCTNPRSQDDRLLEPYAYLLSLQECHGLHCLVSPTLDSLSKMEMIRKGKWRMAVVDICDLRNLMKHSRHAGIPLEVRKSHMPAITYISCFLCSTDL